MNKLDITMCLAVRLIKFDRLLDRVYYIQSNLSENNKLSIMEFANLFKRFEVIKNDIESMGSMLRDYEDRFDYIFKHELIQELKKNYRVEEN